MTIQSHINSLKSRHRDLDDQIQHLLMSAAVDEVEVNDLKRKKLQLKDRIQELSQDELN
ncbi:MAG: DUF465 domain-containing protein [Pseudomonadota bacterium]